MKFNLKNILTLLFSVALLPSANAHEAYVLNDTNFWSALKTTDPVNIFTALQSSPDLRLAIIVTACVLIVFTANFFFRRSRAGQKFHRTLEKASPLGPVFVRLAVAISFLFSALSMSFLGPELSLNSMFVPHLLQVLLIAAAVMIGLGFLTEIGALIALAIFTLGISVYGLYMTTYANYFAEFIVLLLFGTREFSIDRFVFGPLRRFEFFRKYETSIVRIGYGIALIFAAVTIKLLHPSLTIEVINNYNLTQFHWLFPSDPKLIVLGAFLAETAIGLFIAIGFETRLTVLVSLFYLTLSLIYFKELVWPHLILYGISLNLLVTPERFAIDNLLFKAREKLRLRFLYFRRRIIFR